MSELDLEPIKARVADKNKEGWDGIFYTEEGENMAAWRAWLRGAHDDIPALIAEVERLRGEDR